MNPVDGIATILKSKRIYIKASPILNREKEWVTSFVTSQGIAPAMIRSKRALSSIKLAANTYNDENIIVNYPYCGKYLGNFVERTELIPTLVTRI